MKLKLLLTLFYFTSSLLQAQIHIYGGPSFGKLRYFQGSAQTKAFIFNNNTDVQQEMEPNQNFNGYCIGANAYAGIFNFGLEWDSKKSTYGGTRANGVSDEITQQLNAFCFNFGMGNRVESSKPKKIIYRIQATWGGLGFHLKEKLSGTANDFDGVIGETNGGIVRGSVSVLIPIYKKLSINIVPYYEGLDADGYLEVLQDRIKNSEFFNITNYGVNLNLDYGF
jgi:hypothetical protein